MPVPEKQVLAHLIQPGPASLDPLGISATIDGVMDPTDGANAALGDRAHLPPITNYIPTNAARGFFLVASNISSRLRGS